MEGENENIALSQCEGDGSQVQVLGDNSESKNEKHEGDEESAMLSSESRREPPRPTSGLPEHTRVGIPSQTAGVSFFLPFGSVGGK